jgi:hypothetical protein
MRSFIIRMNVKVKLSQCFNWAPRHEGVLGERRYSSTHTLTSALDGDEWPVSRPGCFTPGERASGAHWIGGWVGPEPVWTQWWRENFPTPAGTRTPHHAARSPELYHWGIPAAHNLYYS